MYKKVLTRKKYQMNRAIITNNEMLFDKGTQNRESLIVHLVSGFSVHK